MRVSEAGKRLIRHFEGFQPNVYLCPGGYSTIGFGHVVQPGEDFSRGISLATAERLLDQDIMNAEAAVRRLVPVTLTQGQFDALVSFTFNLGSGALQRSTLRKRVIRGDYLGASNEFLRWIYAGGRPMKGLLKRRKAEAAMFLSEEAANDNSPFRAGGKRSIFSSWLIGPNKRAA